MKPLHQPSFETFDSKSPLDTFDKSLTNLDSFQQVFQLCRSLDRKFIDLEFPPNSKHLIQEKNSIHSYDWSSFLWFRPEKFFKNYEIFKQSNMNQSFSKVEKIVKDITKSDILQGALGNCYFLAALCSMAENTDFIIRRLFITTEINKYGVYCVQLCFNGEWRAVIIDDNFPCYPDERGPCFTKGNNEELWVMLLEKAWAKLHGNYEKVEAGMASESLRSLTGAPVEVYFKDEPNIDMWTILKDAYKNKYPMTAGVDEEENLSGSKIGRKNLVPSHVYSLLSVVEINHPIRGEQRLLKLRNPWGNKEWKGDWSDESTIWTEELVKKLNHNKNADDGTFFIEFKDFKESFSEIAICHYRQEYKHSSLGFKPYKKANYLNVKIESSGEYYFSAIQISRKLIPEEINENFSVVRMIIARVEANGRLRFIAGRQKADQSMFIHLKQMEVGNYVVYIKAFSNNKENTKLLNAANKNYEDLTFSVYGLDKVMIKNVIKIKGFIEKTYLNKAQTSNKKENYKEIGRVDVEKTFELFEDEGFGYFYVCNTGNKKFNSKVTFQKKDGLKLRGVKVNNLIVDFDLAPGTDKILSLGVDYHGYALKYSESLTY